jgi:hypothetical protein
MAKYLLLLHETPAQYADMSPAEMARIIERYSAWAAGLAQRGHLVSGEKLTDDGGRHLHRKPTGVVALDGPYAEAKDVIGGFFIVEADSLAHAERLADDCPHLQGSNWIEVRAIDTM